jgi:hypothetical protein
MGESCTASLVQSMAVGARTCTFSSRDLHQIIGQVVLLHRRGAAKWLQRVTGRSERSVKYWLCGRYGPRGNDALKIVAALRTELAERQRALEQFELQF